MHGQNRVKQTNGWKNVDGGDTKTRPQGLVHGLRDDLWMTDGVGAVFVHPQVKGGDIHIAYLFLPSHSMQGHGACLTPKEGLAGFQGRDKIEGAQKTLDRLIRVDQLVPFALPHFDDCVTRSEQGHAFG